MHVMELLTYLFAAAAVMLLIACAVMILQIERFNDDE